MLNPEDISPGSIMPTYEWLIDDNLSTKYTEAKIGAMRTLGVPYPEGFEAEVAQNMDQQADSIARNILTDLDSEHTEDQVQALKQKEIIALIAYLQRLGADIHRESEVALGQMPEETEVQTPEE